MTTAVRSDGSAPPRWRGVFAIPVTPFDEAGSLDLDSLRRELDFAVETGSPGIVYPVNASEFVTLTDEERLRLLPIVNKQVAGRAPVVAGVAGVSTQAAVRFARAARDAGADAVIAMPPYVTLYDADGIVRYYEAIAEAVGLPVFIQNAERAPIALDLIVRLLREVEHVRYVKEEVPPAHHNLGRLVEQDEPELWGVFSGFSGANFMDELVRGAAGTMPAVHFADVLTRIYDLFAAGDHAGARQLHWQLMPGLNRDRISGIAFYKAALVRRGVIRCARTRGALTPLDAHDYAEMDAIWPDLEALFTVHS